MAGKRENYISWHEYFMSVARLTALRSKDPRTQVGACLTDKDNHILSTGYNGFVKGISDDEGPWDSLGEETNDIMQIKNTFVCHAEANAIDNYFGDKERLKESILYVTLFPCIECTKKIIQNGISCVIFEHYYMKENQVQASLYMFEKAGVSCIDYTSRLQVYSGYQTKQLNEDEFSDRGIGIELTTYEKEKMPKIKAKYRV